MAAIRKLWRCKLRWNRRQRWAVRDSHQFGPFVTNAALRTYRHEGRKVAPHCGLYRWPLCGTKRPDTNGDQRIALAQKTKKLFRSTIATSGANLADDNLWQLSKASHCRQSSHSFVPTFGVRFGLANPRGAVSYPKTLPVTVPLSALPPKVSGNIVP